MEMGSIFLDAVDAGAPENGKDDCVRIGGEGLPRVGLELFEVVLFGTEGVKLEIDDAIQAPKGEGDALPSLSLRAIAIARRGNVSATG
jgi:hypothetical protein